jgi:sugar lactone lactonase YvrE
MLQHPLRTSAPVLATIRTVLAALALILVVGAAGAFRAQPAAAASLPPYLQTYQYAGQFGSHGTADGFLDFPNQITFGPNGDLYVADTHNARIQEFMSDGMWTRTIGVASQPDWGGGNLGFDQPQGVAVSSTHVWGVDNSGGLAWFSLTGTWQGMSLGPNAPSDTFGLPQGAGVDGGGNVYVADGSNSRVLKYDASGAYVCQITNAALFNPVAVGVNAAGAVYVADTVGSDILRFEPTNVAATTYARTATWSAGGLSTPSSIALDAAGDVFIGDTGLGEAGQVVKLSPGGKLLARWGSAGAGNGQFTFLLGVAVDPATNNVYVGDRDADRIQSFQLLDLGPKTYAAANLSVTKGKSVTFKYGVAEDVSAKASASIKVKKGATVKATINLGSVQCGTWLTRKWTCKLAKGSYTWSVYATDQGGHAQVLVGSKTLKVK